MERSEVNMLRKQIQAAIDKADIKGFEVKITNGTYDAFGNTGRFKLEFGVIDASTGVAASPERRAFAEMATMYGLTPDDLDAKFNHRGTTYKITGLKTGRPKFPISVVRVRDNKGFKFPDSTVNRQKRWKGSDRDHATSPSTLAGMVSAGE